MIPFRYQRLWRAIRLLLLCLVLLTPLLLTGPLWSWKFSDLDLDTHWSRSSRKRFRFLVRKQEKMKQSFKSTGQEPIIGVERLQSHTWIAIKEAGESWLSSIWCDRLAALSWYACGFWIKRSPKPSMVWKSSRALRSSPWSRSWKINQESWGRKCQLSCKWILSGLAWSKQQHLHSICASTSTKTSNDFTTYSHR